MAAFAQQGLPVTGGARGLAMGNASATFSDINSAFSNQAGVAMLEKPAFLAFGEQRFLVSALNTYAFAGVVPVKTYGSFGITANYFGYESYNEQKLGLLYARKLAKNFSLGVQLDYLTTRIPEYGMSQSFTFELGFLYKISQYVSVAGHTYNPVRVKLPNGEALPTLFKFGLAYNPSDEVTVTTELEKNINYPMSAKMGLEYRPLPLLALRVGAASAPFRASFGVGVRLDNFVLDFASSYHEVLGFSPAVGLSYRMGQKSETPKAAAH